MKRIAAGTALLLLLTACAQPGITDYDPMSTTTQATTKPPFPTYVLSPPVATGDVTAMTAEQAAGQPVGMGVWVDAYAIVTGDVAQVCDVVMESYPPQCSGTVLTVWDFPTDGFDLETDGTVYFGQVSFNAMMAAEGQALFTETH